MLVYIIRHGESENNQRGLWTGWADAALTEKGKNDAKKAGALLEGVSFDKIYSSDLARAVETARTAIPSASLVTSPLLREINVGALENKPLSVLSAEEREIAFRDGYKEHSGETREDFQKRIAAFMKELAETNCENVAVFSHAGWLRGFLNEVLGVSLPRGAVQCKNCAVGVFEYANSAWTLYSWINF